MAEAVVQVAPDSTGKSIRNEEITVGQQDGSLRSVEMQRIWLSESDREILQSIVDLLKKQLAANILILTTMDKSLNTTDAIDQLAKEL